ncbi:MAG TPA: class 1 fructose-bisphosphatase [Deltaproteobacteria bacterium]|jgi:fructose-1,6-bisphosphatase I|nr:class 1 fructose-bisphosphatase [Deltaproteobacteria bacterium]HRW81121.1 class 1 fructose-bisphosphatase [Desulfomonilia bacterium]HNS90474.1 class 1 fructose-bisphosphatase [Deltaproteobacteria bacterium]HNY67070.1 class 1 fructose-bisphosphatase [Deltaproteobacteria bacterium]HOC76181.1 class 1 fructose-bisphosphatase [Deltaproteobacteria bacterium]
MNDRIISFDRHIMDEQRRYGGRGDFSSILSQIIFAAKVVAAQVAHAGIVEDILGNVGRTNVQGEEVQKLDVYANKLFINALNYIGKVCVMASEEEKDMIMIPAEYPKGDYVVMFDPLDGSTNIDVDVSIGTIFGIFHRITPGGDGTLEDCLQPGRKLFGAGYIIYSSSTILVYSTGHGVNGFSLDPSVGEFVLSHPNITMPKRGKIYSANEGNYPYWKQGTREYIEYLKSERNTRKGPYTSRYIGSLVADFHRNLLKGGIFLYPEDTKDPKKPTGKLRILYEANPLAFIAEQAGGYASTGYEPILDIQPTGLHQRVPLIIGSRDDVLEYEQYAKRN